MHISVGIRKVLYKKSKTLNDLGKYLLSLNSGEARLHKIISVIGLLLM